MLKQDHYSQAKLVELGWRFGQSYGGGHLAGQMVMQVIMNRVRLGWGPLLRMIDVVPDYMAENELPPLVHPSLWEPTFVKLLAAVEGIYDGSVQDMTRGNEFSSGTGKPKSGALYFCALDKVERPWFKNLIAATDPVTGLKQHNRVWTMNTLAGFD